MNMFVKTSISPMILATAVFCMLIAACTTQNKNPETLLNEGVQLFQQEKYKEAIDKYQEALSIDPKNAFGYNLMGMAYRFRFNQLGAQEYKEKEIDAFKKAVELEPKFWVAYKNLSASLYYQGRKKEAAPYIQKALELQPNDPEKKMLLQWLDECNKQQ